MPDDSRMEKRQRVLADFGEFSLRSNDLDTVLTEACRLVADALGTGRAKVLEITDEGRTLFVKAGVGWDKGVVGHVRLPMDELSSETYSITLGEPVITNDLTSEDRFELPAFMKQAGIKALANVPIFLPGGRPFGLLQVDAPEPRVFRDEDSQFLRTYAMILGPVIDRLITVQALSATEERFRTIVEAARDYAIFLTDPQDRITDWLPGAEAVFGWTAEEAIGQSGAILFTPEDRQAGAPEAEVKGAREDGSAPDVRWHLRKDGSRVFIEGSVVALWNEAGELHGFQKIGQDVTKRHLSEEALRESEARFRTLAQTMPQLVWIALDGGECTWVSPRWAEFTGRAAEEMLGWGWLGIVHPDDHARARAAWAATAEQGCLEVEIRLRRADGAWRWFQVRDLPVPGGAGETQQWCGACADVTELKEAEATLREARDAAEAANREKSRFLASVNHDLRQPVMAATLFLDVLKKSALGKAERELVDALVLSLNSLTGMLNGLLEVARLDAGIVQVDVREFVLDDLLQRLNNEFSGVAREARLRLHIPPAPWTVRSDPLLVELILRNLIANALKFTETGGISIEVRVEGTGVAIEVSDTGVGIAPEDMERIFEEYFQAGNTARDHSRGFGIGLATVRRVAALLGTEVTVRSEPGHGSTFTLQLPQAVEPETSAEEPEDEFGLDEPCGTLDGRIALVVDDEPLVLKSLELMLRTLGITVYAARTLADAEAILDGLDQPPDIIISDYTLARGERGTDAIASARRRGAPIAVLITGDTSAARLVEARRSGAQLLHKPIDPGALEDLLVAAVASL